MAKEKETVTTEDGNTAGFVAKITVGSVGFSRLAAKAKTNNAPVLIGDIIGLVTGMKAKELPDGSPSIAFEGSFEATNAETGECLQAGVFYFPSALSGLAVSIAKALQDEPNVARAFAVRLTAVPAANPIGYSYTGENLAPLESADPLAGVKARLLEGKKYLPLPKPAAALTDQSKK